MDIDEVFIRTGEFGTFQKKAFVGFCSAAMFNGCQMVQNIFAGGVPIRKICRIPEYEACNVNCSAEDVKYPDDDYQSYATEV